MYFCSSDLILFHDYVLSLIKELVDDPFCVWDKHSYVNLRDAVVARLTLFNARRGGEPSRLLLSEWNDASNGAWLGKYQTSLVTDPIEKALIEQDKIAYQAGKGNNHLVSVLIPADTLDGLRKLSDPEI